MNLVGCQVTLQHCPDSGFILLAQYYPVLRKAMLERRVGWFEGEHVHGGAPVLFQLEDVIEITNVTQAFVDEKERHESLQRLINGDTTDG